MRATAPALPVPAARWAGFAAGLAGMLIFSATLPMTRLAVADLHPAFIAIGRAALAGLCALALLAWRRPPWPTGPQWRLLAETAAGVVVGFPLFSSIAMRDLPASNGAVITGLLPIATAIAAVLFAQERPRRRFWLCAVAGALLVVAHARASGAVLAAGNLAMLAAVAAGAVGYARGAVLSRTMGGVVAISWALAACLPATLAVSAWGLLDGWALRVPPERVAPASWAAFVYVGLFSMWIGFFFWYRGLARGGVARVGQVQLLQPFATVLLAALVVDEPLSATTAAFAAAVAATVYLSNAQLPSLTVISSRPRSSKPE